mmetsp:Transcript_55244/g.87734  ORF Transcript_55244/g.87734 Transcript_55244/m.87734 type:complete len:293 (+) Transcript_55244:126-1004(+)
MMLGRGLLGSTVILVTIHSASCCPEPPCNGINGTMLQVSDIDMQKSLLLHAMILSQDPVRGNFFVAVVLFTLMVACAMYAAIMQRWEERGTKSQIPSQSMLKGIDEMHFTPDLVVPEGCECVLLVCSKPKRGMTYDVIDSGGGVVLGMEDSLEATPVPRRKLLTPNKVLLGQCVRTQRSFPSQTSTEITFEIFNANHAVFAKLTYEPRQGRDDKVFIETTSQKFLFFGSIHHQTLNLTDFCGRLLATTEPVTQQGPRGEPPGSLLRLRVAPLADVGLVLCSLMCIQNISPGW